MKKERFLSPFWGIALLLLFAWVLYAGGGELYQIASGSGAWLGDSRKAEFTLSEANVPSAVARACPERATLVATRESNPRLLATNPVDG